MFADRYSRIPLHVRHCGTILVCVVPVFILLKYLLFADHKGVEESLVLMLLIIARGGCCYEVPRTLQDALPVPWVS